MGDHKPAVAARAAGGRMLNPAYSFARGRASLFNAARRVNRALDHAGCYKWKPLRSAKATTRALLEKMVSRDREWFLTTIHGFPLWIPQRSVSEYVLHEYEPLTTELFCSSVPKGGTVLDIGANVGLFAVLAARAAGPSGRVFAFEPAPGPLEVLERNIALHGFRNVSCLGQAVTDKPGQQSFIIAEANNSNSFYPHPLSPKRESVLIECTSVDEFLAGGHADVVKVDVEGAEISVVRGMQRTLKQHKYVRLFIELNPTCLKAAGRSGGELVATLKDAGLSVQMIDERNRCIREIDERLVGVPQDDPTYYANLYCSQR